MRLRFLGFWCCSFVLCATVQAASVSWGPTFEIVTDADIDTTYPIVAALDAGANEGETPIDVTLGGNVVTFEVYRPFGGNNFGAGGIPEVASTGNAELDAVFESHSWQGGNPVDPPAEFVLEGLTPGATYQVQLVAAVDGRGCCSGRAQIYQDTLDGSGNNSDRVLRASDVGATGSLYANSVIGTFTADADTQSLWAASGGDDTVDPPIPGNDPGLSAVIVSQVPEPSSIALAVVLGGSALAMRRRFA